MEGFSFQFLFFVFFLKEETAKRKFFQGFLVFNLG